MSDIKAIVEKTTDFGFIEGVLHQKYVVHMIQGLKEVGQAEFWHKVPEIDKGNIL